MKSTFSLLALFLALTLSAQEIDSYYRTKEATHLAKILDSGDELNMQFCTVVDGEKLRRLKPGYVLEYKLPNGMRYVACKLPLSKDSLFAELMVEGRYQLLYYQNDEYRGLWLVGPDSLLKEINLAVDHRAVLASLENQDPRMLAQLPYLPKSGAHIGLYLDSYNQGKLRHLPRFRSGISLGYDFLRPLAGDLVAPYAEALAPRGQWTYGLWAEFPWVASDFSFFLEAQYQWIQESYSLYQSSTEDLDLILRQQSISVPLMMRYNWPSYSYRGFVQAGILLRHDLYREGGLFRTDKSPGMVEIEKLTNRYPDWWQLGFSVGIGYEVKVWKERSAFFEARYYQYLPSVSSQFYRHQGISLISSFNLW